LINGEIDGDCDLSGSVTLAEKGYYKGTLKADAIIISGKVDGDIIANGIVKITDSARINGTVTGTFIAIAEGAIIEGEMQTSSRNALLKFVEKRQD
jgi:cytoskeletal protein CcmA (bactofilin family)